MDKIGRIIKGKAKTRKEFLDEMSEVWDYFESVKLYNIHGFDYRAGESIVVYGIARTLGDNNG